MLSYTAALQSNSAVLSHTLLIKSIEVLPVHTMFMTLYFFQLDAIKLVELIKNLFL